MTPKKRIERGREKKLVKKNTPLPTRRTRPLLTPPNESPGKKYPSIKEAGDDEETRGAATDEKVRPPEKRKRRTSPGSRKEKSGRGSGLCTKKTGSERGTLDDNGRPLGTRNSIRATIGRGVGKK